MMSILAYHCNVMNCNSSKPLTMRDGSNWKQKLKIGKVWTSSEMCLKALTGRMELKGCSSTKDVTSHSHLSGHFSNLGRERRKKMLKILQRSLSNKTYRKKNVKHHHLNVGDVQLVDLYIKIIKCAWCMKRCDKSDPTLKTGTLMRISTLTEWREFKRHTVNIKDELLRVQLSKLVEAISALSEPLAADLMYHFHVCQIILVTCASIRRKQYISKMQVILK